MSLYIVRCNFNDPDREEEWNRWYSTDHSAKLLALPGFQSVTRYRAVGLDKAIKYMAVWSIDRPDLLQSEPYKAVGGGSWPESWRSSISDWSRTIYEEI